MQDLTTIETVTEAFNEALKKALAPLEKRTQALGEQLNALLAEEGTLKVQRRELVAKLATESVDLAEFSSLDARMAEITSHIEIVRAAQREIMSESTTKTGLKALIVRLKAKGEQIMQLETMVRAELKCGNKYSDGRRAALRMQLEELATMADGFVKGASIHGIRGKKLESAVEQYVHHHETECGGIPGVAA